MSFSVYENMCMILYEGDDDGYLFAHAFLTMEWNFMARADNCVNMHVNHVQWQDDCLLFFFGKSKKNRLEMHQTDLGMFIQIQIHPISVLFWLLLSIF